MNINDVELQDYDSNVDRLEAIFNKQKMLYNRYGVIEEAKGIGHGILNQGVFNIDDARSQYLVKDFCWRVTEELAEAAEAFSDQHYEHGREELADAFHFLVELCIIVGISHKDFTLAPKNRLSAIYKRYCAIPVDRLTTSNADLMWGVTVELGLAANCLKNKPWKQTQMETDEKKFIRRVKGAFIAFIVVCDFNGMGPDELFETYFKKSEVNKFRIRSEY